MIKRNMDLNYKNDNIVFCEELSRGIPLLIPTIFNGFEWIKCFITTRHGGVSSGYLSSLNLSETVGDSAENILENFNRISKAIGIVSSDIVYSHQTHTTNILIVDEKYKGEGVTKERSFHDIDALITDKKSICLATSYADCVPLIFADVKNRVVAVAHSGWKGTVKQIGKLTIEKMMKEYGSLPVNIKCQIGPSICQDCYEVSFDVIEEFKKAYNEKYYNELFYKKKNGKYQLNLWKACEITLLNAGIKKENLAITNVCTACNSENLFSHRKTSGKRGNFGVFIMMK